MTPAPAVLHLTHSLRAAQALFAEKRFRHFPVVRAGKLMGVISNEDVASFLLNRPGGLDLEVSFAMTPDPIAVTPETTAARAARLLLTHRIRCLPVVNDQGILVGMVTATDLLRLLVRVLGDQDDDGPPTGALGDSGRTA
jgi:CBS domain-containing protein